MLTNRRTTLAITGALAVGAFAGIGLRGQAGQKPTALPPVQPPAQVLAMENAFEQVANRLRPTVVYIQSQRTISAPSGFRQGAQGDDDDSPFSFGFPGMPGMPGAPGGGQQFRSMPRKAVASGSGVIVRDDGYILTNDHVVNGATKVTVRLQDGSEFTGQVKRDFRSDLALIKINATGLPYAELSDSDRVKVGQWAIAFGSPFGLNDTMTVGIISSLHRKQEIGAGTDGRLYPSLIQTDASINPGNSGGPLVDVYGRVVGVNVAIESPSGGNVGIGFAIPANTAKYVMAQLIEKGTVTRGYLGLAPQTLSYNEQQRYGIKEGALVASVEDNTPASKAGFQVEDVITRFDGKPVPDEAALRDLVSRTTPGSTVNVTVRRGSSERSLSVTIGKAPDLQVAGDQKPDNAQQAQGKLGVSVANANDPDARKQLNLKGAGGVGALIMQVAPGSPAAEAGLQPGDTILRLNGKSVPNADSLSAIVRDLPASTVSAVIRRGGQTVLVDISLE